MSIREFRKPHNESTHPDARRHSPGVQCPFKCLGWLVLNSRLKHVFNLADQLVEYILYKLVILYVCTSQ